jgi:hypothetical protein
MSDNFVKDFLTADTHGIPNFVWIGIVAGGLGVGIYFKNKASNASPTAIGTVDPYAQTATGTGPVDTSSNAVSQNPYPVTMTVRPAGLYPAEDKLKNGVAVRFTASYKSAVLYWAPFNSSIVVTGPSITGDGSGSPDTWYPVGGGYINAVDVH